MANLSFNSSLSLDLGLSGISYQARESVQESLPALREIAPLEEPPGITSKSCWPSPTWPPSSRPTCGRTSPTTMR